MPIEIRVGGKMADIAGQIEKAIEDEVYKPGDRLPSRSQMSEMFGVGESTVNMAIQLLKFMDLIEGRQGSGYFVKVKQVCSHSCDVHCRQAD
jgi:DNA-binding GntR family transcriptional regulator